MPSSKNIWPTKTSRQKYQTAPGKLGLIRAVLRANIFKPTQTCELQCLGIVLGDAFVQELKMEWVVVEDGSGRDPGVRLPLFPLTMISKRVERGGKVDVFDLFNAMAAKVEQMQKGGYDRQSACTRKGRSFTSRKAIWLMGAANSALKFQHISLLTADCAGPP
ncbi:MAG TPA: DUF3806 domain-containing protein [Xanthobacteraceae bacterium]